MGILEAALLGVVEGVTEFLPISSTGHLILASSLLGISQTAFHKTFEIAIQLGAILSVVVLYWRSFFDIELLKKILVAFIPTGVVGFLLYPLIKGHFLGNESLVLWMLLIGGVALIIFELVHTERGEFNELATITYGQALFVGLFQAMAVVPGVSRSAASIVGGLIAGMRRVVVVEFSFLLAVPTMLAATGFDIFQSSADFSGAQVGVLTVGFVTSFVVALFAIQFLLSFVRQYTFIPFGIYRIALALLFFFIVL